MTKKRVAVIFLVLVIFFSFVFRRQLTDLAWFMNFEIRTDLKYAERLIINNKAEYSSLKETQKFILKYCPAEISNGLWKCYTDMPVTGHASYIFSFLENKCVGIGYKWSGWDGWPDFFCYKFDDGGKECLDSPACQSGWCVPNSLSCVSNCVGKCSETKRMIQRRCINQIKNLGNNNEEFELIKGVLMPYHSVSCIGGGMR